MLGRPARPTQRCQGQGRTGPTSGRKQKEPRFGDGPGVQGWDFTGHTAPDSAKLPSIVKLNVTRVCKDNIASGVWIMLSRIKCSTAAWACTTLAVRQTVKGPCSSTGPAQLHFKGRKSEQMALGTLAGFFLFLTPTLFKTLWHSLVSV
jgi:hypothetical protein